MVTLALALALALPQHTTSNARRHAPASRRSRSRQGARGCLRSSDSVNSVKSPLGQALPRLRDLQRAASGRQTLFYTLPRTNAQSLGAAASPSTRPGKVVAVLSRSARPRAGARRKGCCSASRSTASSTSTARSTGGVCIGYGAAQHGKPGDRHVDLHERRGGLRVRADRCRTSPSASSAAVRPLGGERWPPCGAAALLAVTAVWGVTFVQVKDAVAVYPLFPFLALRFAIATLVLAPFAARRAARRSAGAGSGRRRSPARCSPAATRCRRSASSARPSRAPASSPACTSC